MQGSAALGQPIGYKKINITLLLAGSLVCYDERI